MSENATRAAADNNADIAAGSATTGTNDYCVPSAKFARELAQEIVHARPSPDDSEQTRRVMLSRAAMVMDGY